MSCSYDQIKGDTVDARVEYSVNEPLQLLLRHRIPPDSDCHLEHRSDDPSVADELADIGQRTKDGEVEHSGECRLELFLDSLSSCELGCSRFCLVRDLGEARCRGERGRALRDWQGRRGWERADEERLEDVGDGVREQGKNERRSSHREDRWSCMCQ